MPVDASHFSMVGIPVCESAWKFGSDSILMQTARVLVLISIGESVRWLSGS